MKNYFYRLAEKSLRSRFSELWKEIQSSHHERIVEAGFYDNGGAQNFPERIALIHSELSEALEAYRNGNPESKKIPGYSEIEEEFADVFLRIADVAENWELDIIGAMFAKMDYNKSREYKHGKKI